MRKTQQCLAAEFVALSVESCTWHSIDLDAFQFGVNEASNSGGEKIRSNRIMPQSSGWRQFFVVMLWPDTQGGGSPSNNCVMLEFIDARRSFAWELFMRKVQQWCIVAGQANKVGLRPRVSVKQASPTRRRPESADTLQFFMASREQHDTLNEAALQKTIVYICFTEERTGTETWASRIAMWLCSRRVKQMGV